jgi:3-oxoacyl-[acyl-carrier protein] reductase
MTESTALVTGAANGIGRAIAERFARGDQYDAVACLDIEEAVREVADGLDGGVGRVVDVSDHDAVADCVADLESDRTIDAAVNNAAVSSYAWIGDLEPDEWDRVLDVNLKGQYNVARAVGPRMYEREHGYIVNVSSGAGQRGSVSAGVHYSASKAGILGLTKGLAKQLSPHVHVNAFVPGLTDTNIGQGDSGEDDAGDEGEADEGIWTEEGRETMRDLIPFGREADPDEVARVAEFLCGEGAAYMTGSVVTADGGAALGPTQNFLMPDE